MDFIFGRAPYTSYSNLKLCSNVDIKDSWAHQILQRAHKNFKWPIKIWKFEWDMGHWSILRAHHHFRLGLSLLLESILEVLENSLNFTHTCLFEPCVSFQIQACNKSLV